MSKKKNKHKIQKKHYVNEVMDRAFVSMDSFNEYVLGNRYMKYDKKAKKKALKISRKMWSLYQLLGNKAFSPN